MIRAPAATCEPAGRPSACARQRRLQSGCSDKSESESERRLQVAGIKCESKSAQGTLGSSEPPSEPPTSGGEGRANKLNGRRKVKWGLPWAALEPI